MASKVHPKFNLDYGWVLGEDGWNTEMDNNLRDLALFTQPIAEAITDTPPVSPVNGETHVIGTSPSGIFAGKNNQIAIYLDTAWTYYTAYDGYFFIVKADGLIYTFNGSVWVAYAPAGSGDMLKSVYDIGNTGFVDNAAKVNGVDSAGNDKYYGTDGVGAVGFHDLPAGVGAQSIGYSTDVDITTTAPVLFDLLQFDGTNFVPINIIVSNVRLAFSIIGQMISNEDLLIYQVVDTMTLPVGLAGSSCYAEQTATGAVAIDIQKNGASVGTVDFAIGTNIATFTFASETSFVSGDRIKLVAPASADATLGDISLTLLASL